MCGICGVFHYKKTASDIDRIRLQRMVHHLQHRGPDDAGTYISDGIGLGHTRLSILDLSARGRQPMANEDESVWVVFNGEIYNYVSLRRELQSHGHNFRTRTDTEVLVHGYETWGGELLSHIDGMFAFAIWDESKQRLFLARDRLGQKPLYYADIGGTFFFASEAHALLAAWDQVAVPDDAAIAEYLAYMYIPAPITAFRGISKLPAAHALMVDKGKTPRTERYWQPNFQQKTRLRGMDLQEAVQAEINSAVASHLRSDVPLGVFLSGGLDSSAVLAGVRKSVTGPIQAFSVRFAGADYDETALAAQVARRFEADLTVLTVEMNVTEVLPLLVWHYAEPFADSSAVPVYYLSRSARQHVKVCLSGDGGDEILGGYSHYRALRYAQLIQSVRGLRPLLRFSAAIFPNIQATRRLKTLLRLSDPNEADTYAIAGGDNYLPVWSEAIRFRNPRDSWRVGTELRSLFRESNGDTLVDRWLYADTFSRLADDYLTKVDRASMACSLEVRAPLLDHHLYEFAAMIPANIKVGFLQTKRLMRQAYRSVLPEELTAVPKQGFTAPVDEWCRGPLRPYLSAILADDNAAIWKYLQRSFINQLWHEHLSYKKDHRHRLWSILIFELWHRMFIQRPPNMQIPQLDELIQPQEWSGGRKSRRL